MAGGDAYSLPGQADTDDNAAEALSTKLVAPLPQGLRASTLAPLSKPQMLDPMQPEEPQLEQLVPQPESLSGKMLHVRGIGADGWDGTPDGKGRYESEAALKLLFQPFGAFRQATIRHRIDNGANTSWALVTMGDAAAVDAILKSHAEAPIFAGDTKLVLNRYSKTQAKLSTGGMVELEKKDAERRTWPDWLKNSKLQHPKMDAVELRSLRAVFERNATRGKNGELIVTLLAMGQLLEEAMHEIFNAIDEDRSGELERQEIRDLMRMLGRQLTEAQLTEVFGELDEDGNGVVDYREFKSWWDTQEYQSDIERETELRDLFDIVDSDSSGEIDWQEFVQLIASQVCRNRSDTNSNAQPVDAATLVRTALEAVRADVRAIYGTNSRQVPRLQLLSAEEQIAKRMRCFLRPDKAFRKQWDLVQVVMLLYVATMVPLRIGFNMEAEPWTLSFVIEAIVDAYFVVDIGIQFRSAYFENKQLVVDTGKIARRYARTWFPIDVVSCLPINYVQLIMQQIQEGSTSGNTSEAKLLKILRLLRLAKLLRLARIQRLLDRLKDDYEGLAQFLEMSKITITIFYVAHFVACFWYLVGDDEADIVGHTSADSHCTRSDNGEECLPAGVVLYQTFEGAGADSENGGSVLHGWVKRNGWDIDEHNPNLWTRYLDCFYFSVTTLTT